MTAASQTTDDQLLGLSTVDESLAWCSSRVQTVLELLDFDSPLAPREQDAHILAEYLVRDLKTALEDVSALGAAADDSRWNPAAAGRLVEAESLLASAFPPIAQAGALAPLRAAVQTIGETITTLRGRVRSLQRGNPAHRAARRAALLRRATGISLAVAVFVTPAIFVEDRLALANFRQRVRDFGVLATALEAYRRAQGAYPLSEGNGEKWSGIGWADADPARWLQGLVPAHLPRLPRDPRRTLIPHAQYVYRSDGQDYKLIALLPEDCNRAVRRRPELSDPVRNVNGICAAYGVWTAGAKEW